MRLTPKSHGVDAATPPGCDELAQTMPDLSAHFLTTFAKKSKGREISCTDLSHFLLTNRTNHCAFAQGDKLPQTAKTMAPIPVCDLAPQLIRDRHEV